MRPLSAINLAGKYSIGVVTAENGCRCRSKKVLYMPRSFGSAVGALAAWERPFGVFQNSARGCEPCTTSGDSSPTTPSLAS